MTDPLISVIIVNYNGKNYLKECLKHVLASDYDRFEIIVVDNGSTDSSPELVREIMRKTDKPLKLLVNPFNVGPAKARNQAADLAVGELLAFLDNDTRPDPGWLKEAVNLLKDPKIGALQCKLILDRDDKLLDSIGAYLGSFGFLVQKVPPGKVRDVGQFNEVTDIFSTKSAGMLIRKTLFDKIGRFDPDYFIYNEEMDLCWRVWTAGYKVVFAPNSVVYHNSGSTRRVAAEIADELLYFHGIKNYLLTVLKNVDSNAFLKTVIPHMVAWLAISILMTFRKRPIISYYILRGILWNLRHMKITMKKRARNIGRKQLPKHILVHLPLRNYLDTLKRF
ncbi:MAG: glycosyltransferase family 2 protein [Nitrososphaerota archaeon]